jgi:hypothetical protein
VTFELSVILPSDDEPEWLNDSLDMATDKRLASF